MVSMAEMGKVEEEEHVVVKVGRQRRIVTMKTWNKRKRKTPLLHQSSIT